MSSLRRLIIFGDSFVEGYRCVPRPETTEYNFPFFLAEELGIEVVNLGIHGHSNLAVASDVITYLRDKTDEELATDAFLICFSEWTRMSEKNSDDSNTVNELRGITWMRQPNKDTPDEVLLRVQTDLAYLGVKQLCETKGVPFRMINSYDSQNFLDTLDIIECVKRPKGRIEDIRLGSKIWKMVSPSGDDNWIESNSKFNTILDIITDNWLSCNDKTSMFNYMQDVRSKQPNNPFMTPCGHPTIKGNKLIAKTLAPYLKVIIEQ